MIVVELDMFSCCEHCGCSPSERAGHDDTCTHGCNDEEMGLDSPRFRD